MPDSSSISTAECLRALAAADNGYRDAEIAADNARDKAHEAADEDWRGALAAAHSVKFRAINEARAAQGLPHDAALLTHNATLSAAGRDADGR